MIRTRAAAASKPGTDALLELLANLLSPGLAPGLAYAATTPLALAAAVDDVRAKLFAQQRWAGGDGLHLHTAGVQACISSKPRQQSPAEASARCRWLHSLHGGRAQAAAAAARGAGAAVPNGATVIAVATGVLKSDHKPLIKKAWDPTLRTVVAYTLPLAAGAAPAPATVHLAYFEPGKAAAKFAFTLPTDGAPFSGRPLAAQALPCSDFLDANRQNHFVNDQVSDGCGTPRTPAGRNGVLPSHDECYCFGLLEPNRILSGFTPRVMRIRIPGAIGRDFAAAIKEALGTQGARP
jgi:hypothetical protein